MVVLNKWTHQITTLFHQPLKIFWICIVVAMTSVVLDGSFLRLWGLYREQERMEERIVHARAQNIEWERRLQKAEQPAYIERQARDQLDLVKEGDLVFVFADENAP